MLPKDYLAHWLTGNYSMDFSDAAGTLLLDVEKQEWSQDILDKFDIQQSVLPTLFGSADEVGILKTDLKEKFGLENVVKVFAGGADNACAALGSGVIGEGTAMVSIGTSGVFLSAGQSAKTDYQGDLHLFNHTVDNAYYAMGVTLAAGNSLYWFKETFAPETSFVDLLKDISKIAPGAQGLLFTPYIVGERTPHTDSQIRGSFIGLDTRHRLPHLSRAVLEGITFSLKDSQNIMEQKMKNKIHQIVSVGGGAKNPDWLQIQADIFEAEMITLTTEQGPGMGAAMLAAIGCGLCTDFADCVETFVKYDKFVKPNVENVEKYRQVYNIYQKVYPATAPICHELLEL